MVTIATFWNRRIGPEDFPNLKFSEITQSWKEEQAAPALGWGAWLGGGRDAPRSYLSESGCLSESEVKLVARAKFEVDKLNICTGDLCNAFDFFFFRKLPNTIPSVFYRKYQLLTRSNNKIFSRGKTKKIKTVQKKQVSPFFCKISRFLLVMLQNIKGVTVGSWFADKVL